jgi:benzoylformate decarboxylase
VTSAAVEATVRDACWDVLRSRQLTRIFANPGSTEVPLLVGMPEDFEFVLGLHESAVVGMATGAALATGSPALALLHTTAGLGNAIGSLATARENRVPLVVLVGQQDRRHLGSAPFLAGDLEGLGGTYPVWVSTPPRPEDLPDHIARASNEAVLHRGPALVIVPMGDWAVPMPDRARPTTPSEIVTSTRPGDEVVERIAEAIARAVSPVIVSGAGSASHTAWQALQRLAGAHGVPVWQEPFGAAPGFPQTDVHFRGVLAAGRAEMRAQLAGHDLVLVIGAHAVRQYGFEPGPLFDDGVRVVVVTDDPAKAVVSTADLALVADIGVAVNAIADRLGTPADPPPAPRTPVPVRDDRLTAELVFSVFGAAADADVVVFEETPSTRVALTDRFPARNPHAYLSAAMGGLGFAMPAAVGYRMAAGDRPVIAFIGDGSAMYSIQSLWSAQRYGAGVLFVILVNGGYAIMDQLAAAAGGEGPWPAFPEVSLPHIAAGFGCRARVVADPGELAAAVREILPDLRDASSPTVLVVALDGGDVT